MIAEKSCGAVIYRKVGEGLEFLVVKSKPNGHWGFPKGHVEKGESEEETAKREVFEETGLSVSLHDGFRTRIEYPLANSRLKEVIFFISEVLNQSVNIQEEEIEEFRWVKYSDAFDTLTFKNNKQVLMEARDFLNSEKYNNF